MTSASDFPEICKFVSVLLTIYVFLTEMSCSHFCDIDLKHPDQYHRETAVNHMSTQEVKLKVESWVGWDVRVSFSGSADLRESHVHLLTSPLHPEVGAGNTGYADLSRQ